MSELMVINKGLVKQSKRFISNIFENFTDEDISDFIKNIINIYKNILKKEYFNEIKSLPLFSEIMKEATYLYYRKLYDIEEDAKLSKDEYISITDKLYSENSYIDLMEFVDTVLESYKLTFAYFDDYDNDKSITVINSSQLDIFDIL